MENNFNLDAYYPTREEIETNINSLNIDWNRVYLEWDDFLDLQLELGKATIEDVEKKAKIYKNSFVEGILKGSLFDSDEAMPILLQALFDYSKDTDGAKLPYYNSIETYWHRKFLKENNREPSIEEMMAWQSEEVIENYIKGGFRQFEDLEEDMGYFTEKGWMLSCVWKEFLNCQDFNPNRGAALAYGVYISMFLYDF